jgi:hypothetical protein
MIAMQQVEVIGPLAEEFRAYTSLQNDMVAVTRLLGELLARPSIDQPSEDDPIATALWESAVIMYGRCFKQGRRKGYMNRLEVPPDERTVHLWMLKLRDDHVAHIAKNNLGEQLKAMLFLNPGAPRSVDGVGVFLMRLTHPERAAIERALTLSKRIAEMLGSATKVAGENLLAQAQLRPIEDLYRAAAGSTSVRFLGP